MPIIKPVSDLRNYNEVLKDISVGEPVFLTKNGRGRYVILDVDEYNRNAAELRLLSELLEAENCEKEYTIEELDKELGLCD